MFSGVVPVTTYKSPVRFLHPPAAIPQGLQVCEIDASTNVAHRSVLRKAYGRPSSIPGMRSQYLVLVSGINQEKLC